MPLIQLREALELQIKEAFAGVTLGNGIGLSQGNAIDDYMTEEYQLKCREKDEKKEWEKISSIDLNQFYAALSYFDAEGMRFHLPAYIILDLNNKFNFDVIYCLTNLDRLNSFTKSNPVIFNKKQKLAIAEYLRYMIKFNLLHESELQKTEKALSEYWLNV